MTNSPVPSKDTPVAESGRREKHCASLIVHAPLTIASISAKIIRFI